MASSRRYRDLGMAINGLEELAERLQDVGGDLKKTMTDVLENTADEISSRTVMAVSNQNLPRQGEYSKGVTIKSVLLDQTVRWEGPVATIGAGFDKTKPGAGGWLITGTPRMKPVLELEKIFGGWKTQQNKFIKDLNFDARQIMLDAIEEAMEGKK